MKNVYALIASVFICSASFAQDIHFTMFHAAPTVLNPGAAGLFNGTFRASTNFKTQWGSISNPYNTFSFTADGALWKNRGGNAHMGAGISAYRDVAGSTNYGTTKINLSISTILYLDENNTASIGLTGGWVQRTIAPEDLQWDSQFNGQAFDASLPSYENYTFENNSYFDFAAGAMWSYGTAASSIASFDKFHAQAGIAYHHLSRPLIVNYYGENEKLYSKFVAHGDLHIATGYSRLAFRPRFTAFFQGPSREINVGTMVRYLVMEGAKYTGFVKGFAFSLGGYYRLGDAFSPSMELEFGGFSLGYSYDFNLSGLRVATGGMGGHEVYLKFQNPNPFFKFSRNPSHR